MWSHRLMVRTSPFHGGNMGSSPVGITNKKPLLKREVFLLTLGARTQGSFNSDYVSPRSAVACLLKQVSLRLLKKKLPPEVFLRLSVGITKKQKLF